MEILNSQNVLILLVIFQFYTCLCDDLVPMLTDGEFTQAVSIIESKISEMPPDGGSLVTQVISENGATYYYTAEDKTNPVFASMGTEGQGQKTIVLSRGEDHLEHENRNFFVVLQQKQGSDYAVYNVYLDDMDTGTLIWSNAEVKIMDGAEVILELYGDDSSLQTRGPKCTWFGMTMMLCAVKTLSAKTKEEMAKNKPSPNPEEPGNGGTDPGNGNGEGDPKYSTKTRRPHTPGNGGTDPGNGGTDPGHGGTDPGNGGTDPGHGGTDPGHGGTDPGHGGTDPGHGGTDPGHGGTDPGHGGTDPGHGGTDPGHGGTDPGHGGTDPGHGGTDPGHGGTDPGHGGTDPGHGGTDPGKGGTDPGHGGTDPGHGGTDPGKGGTDPGKGGTDPGHGGTDPGHGGTDPGHGGTDPGNGGNEPGEDETWITIKESAKSKAHGRHFGSMVSRKSQSGRALPNNKVNKRQTGAYNRPRYHPVW